MAAPTPIVCNPLGSTNFSRAPRYLIAPIFGGAVGPLSRAREVGLSKADDHCFACFERSSVLQCTCRSMISVTCCAGTRFQAENGVGIGVVAGQHDYGGSFGSSSLDPPAIELGGGARTASNRAVGSSGGGMALEASCMPQKRDAGAGLERTGLAADRKRRIEPLVGHVTFS